jgi:hexosaminidase
MEKKGLLVIFLLFNIIPMLLSAASRQWSTREGRISIVPLPAHAEIRPGYFEITPGTRIVYSRDNQETSFSGEMLASQLRMATGFPLEWSDDVAAPKSNSIVFDMTKDGDLGPEGYRLEVERKKIHLSANTGAGLFYAVQSLLQLLPPEVMGKSPAIGFRWRIPCVVIQDNPRFGWRGMHLDVSRHFFPKEFIKTYIDMLAMHKMNIFHWHLTDDQGWRIEIKKYPLLTQVAAWHVDRSGQDWNSTEPPVAGEKATYGGFYTQEEIREIVHYAAERHITIVPEIEMPAHTVAALAAYPQFSCTGGPFMVPPASVWPDKDIFCAGNDDTFEFIQNILSEVIDLFPGKYIHIGGDEADKTEWKKCPKCQARIRDNNLKDESELQSYFIKRIEKFLVSKNRRLIGWDEILEGGLAPEATVMSWRGMEGGIAAAQAEHDVVMTPGSHCYFDFYQGKPESEPRAIGGYTPLSKVYSFEPVPEHLTPQQAKHILGAQANVWTEFISTPEHAQYMTMPRMAAMAEVLWSPKESRQWKAFVPRVERLMRRYEVLKYNYSKSAYLVDIAASPDASTAKMTVSLSTEMKTPEIHFTLDGSDPTASSTRYKRPFQLNRSSAVRAGAFRNGQLLGKISEQKIILHKGLFKPVSLKQPYERYTGGGKFGLVDGIRGTISHQDGKWQGFHQADLDAVVDLGEKTPISKITTGYLQETMSGVFLPTAIEYSVSDDGIHFVTVARFENPIPSEHQEAAIRDFTQTLQNVKARYVRVFARNVGLCPDWHPGKGDKAWLFIDEIVVE